MSTDRNELILQTATEGFWDWDLRSDQAFLSPRYRELLGDLSEDTIFDSTFFRTIIHPEDRDQVFSVISDYLQGKRNDAIIEYRMRMSDGTYRWFEGRGCIVEHDPHGAPVRMVGTISDISQRKDTEEKLRLSEQKFSAAFHSSPDSININRLNNGVYLAVNEGFCTMSGYTPEEVIGKSSLDLNIWVDPCDRAAIVAELKKKGFCNNMEARFRRKDGTIFFGSMSARIIEFDGEPCFLNTTRDISHHKHEEDKIRKSEALLRCIIDSVGDIIFVKDTNGVYQACNKAGVDYIGLPESEQIGKTDYDLFGHDQANDIRNIDRQIMSSGTALRVEEWIAKQDGTGELLETTKTPFFSQSGELLGIVGVSRDITEQKHAETLLRESERKYRLLSENVVDVIWTIDLQTMRFTYVSPSIVKLRGIPPIEALKESLADFMTPESYQRARELFNEAIQSCKYDDHSRLIQTHRFDMVHRDGHIVPTETVTTLISDEENHVCELLGVTRDISDRINAEQALRTSEERHRTLLKSVMDGFIVVGEDERIVAVNETYCRMSGYTEQELLALRIHDIAIDETPETINEMTQLLMKQGECRFESRHRRRDGTIFDTEVSIQYNHDTGQGVSIIRDISSRKQAETAIRLSEERHRSILRTTMDGFWMMDTRGQFIEVNDTICRMLGYTEQELLNSRIADIETAETPEVIATHFNKIADTGEDRFESRLRHKNGSLIDVEVSVQFRPIEDGRFVAFIRDITARKKAEEELQKKNADMEQFTYTVSHDLRSPLVTMKTFLGYLEEDMASSNGERISQDLQFIHTAADKMKTLLDELLELSRIDRIDGELEQVSLREVFDEVLGSLAGSIDEQGAEIILPEYDVTLFADRRRLCQIWQNLIENAIKYRSKLHPPRIELTVREEHGTVIFCVRDNGIGIDSQYHEKIFGIFEKLDPATPGAGLGLSMLKRIINKSGGTIWVESDGSGHGSCFCFTLPEALAAG